MLSKVDSCPPCSEEEEENTHAGLSIKAPDIHRAEVLSIKYFIGAAILPKRVGLPKARPAQPLKSSKEA